MTKRAKKKATARRVTPNPIRKLNSTINGMRKKAAVKSRYRRK